MDKEKNTGFINRTIQISERIENRFIVRVIRNGLVTMIPILMIGAFALVLQSFPVAAYQNFIQTFLGGFFYDIFHMIYEATFGVMSLYMTLVFSTCFFMLKAPEEPVSIWGVGSAMASFLIMVGIWSEDFSASDLGAASVFLAIATSLISCEIYYWHAKALGRKRTIFSFGADSRLSTSMEALTPTLATITTAALLSFGVALFGGSTMRELVNQFFLYAFNLIDSLFLKGLSFIFVSSLLWLFGIHGSDCLQGVSDSVFTPLMNENLLAVSNNEAAKEILCKPFFDCFILMGGCGSSICLFLAILLFSRNKSMRTIAKSAGFPILFNINELLVFGLPIVFNPAMAIPFLLVPVLQYLISYGALASGLVPLITRNIEWTTPVLISGYTATGSIRGSILQLVNIVIGVAIYAPFVKIMARVKEDREETNRESFVKWYIADEAKLETVRLLGLRGLHGDLAKRMALELRDGVTKEAFELYYQPQYNYEGECIGVEALLRWPSVKWLSVYPPLLIQLAKEQGILLEMEKSILKRAMSEREKVFQQFGRGIKISVNVTGSSAADQAYWDYLKDLWHENPVTEGTLCVEVTEQDAIVFNDEVIEEFKSCKALGIRFAIDDFSAGQTSMEYLKNGIFDLLKLDGSLVRVVNENPRCREIVSSLADLARSLEIDCLAEYVENEEIRQTLHEIGCDQYQGYLYSPAVPLKDAK